MAYMTETDLFDAQHKDYNLLNIWPLTIRVCGGGPMSGGTMCTKNMI